MADVAVFVSYRHLDDDASYGRITKISGDVRRTYRSLSGLEVGLFFDTDTESIDLGDHWRDRIRAGLTDATILLPFISPLYLGSSPCRAELQEFISVVSDVNSQKLIIPLLFTPVDNIEDRFRNDELWTQIVALQYLDASELRTEEPGSRLWMEKVSVIAERMRRALDIPDLSVPPPTGSIESPPPAPSGPGTLELLADFQTNVPALHGIIERLSSLLVEFNQLITEATPRMSQAEMASQKLAVANDLASRLMPIADQFSVCVQEFQNNLDGIDSGVRVIFRMLRDRPRDEWDAGSVEFLQSIKDLAEISLANTTTMDQFSVTVGTAKGFSSNLDKPLQRMQSATLMLAGNRGIYKHWLDELEELDQRK